MVRDVEDLRAQIDDAVQKTARTQARIAQSFDSPAAGDLYTFSATAPEGIEWALVMRHLDDPSLWFAVPFDQNALVGTWDVSISEFSDAGTGTLRCGHGIWIHADDLAFGDRSGFLEAVDVKETRARLAAMVKGDGSSVVFQPTVDDDPDYQEWIEEVACAAERLDSRLRAPAPIIVSLADFSVDWNKTPGVHSDAPYALAAESGGLGSGPAEAIVPLPGGVVARDLPGTLVAVREPSGVRLLYHATADEPAPRVSLKSSTADLAVSWRQLATQVHESIEILDPSDSLTIWLQNDLCYRLSQ